MTYVFYDCEEVDAARNGLGQLSRTMPELISGDFAVLMEPSNARVEGGCQGTLHAHVTVRGERAHSAQLAGKQCDPRDRAVLQRLADYRAERVVVDGLEYREGLNATVIRGGQAANVIPDGVRGQRQLPVRAEPHRREGVRPASSSCSRSSR